MLTGLNGDTEYTFAGLAYNGYASKLFTASIKTTGVYNPGLESEFLYSDFLPQKEATLEGVPDFDRMELLCRQRHG